MRAEPTPTPGFLRGVCYVYVMAIKRITISVPADVAARIKKAAGSTPISAWVTDRIEEHLDDAELERLWTAFYREVAPAREDTRAAAAILKRATNPSRRRRRAA